MVVGPISPHRSTSSAPQCKGARQAYVPVREDQGNSVSSHIRNATVLSPLPAVYRLEHTFGWSKATCGNHLHLEVHRGWKGIVQFSDAFCNFFPSLCSVLFPRWCTVGAIIAGGVSLLVAG